MELSRRPAAAANVMLSISCSLLHLTTIHFNNILFTFPFTSDNAVCVLSTLFSQQRNFLSLLLQNFLLII